MGLISERALSVRISWTVLFQSNNQLVLFLITPGADEVPNYQEVLVDSAGRYQVNCSARFTQHNSGEGWFYLYSDGKPVAETRAWHDGRILSFNLTEEALSVTRGELTCQYGGNRLNDTVVLWTEGETREMQRVGWMDGWMVGMVSEPGRMDMMTLCRYPQNG